MKTKQDLSLYCNLDDEDMTNDCWNCSRFLFPIGCMVIDDTMDIEIDKMIREGGRRNNEH